MQTSRNLPAASYQSRRDWRSLDSIINHRTKQPSAIPWKTWYGSQMKRGNTR
ncbi:MAG: hypothetical protein ACJA0V_003038, partial [Planctomycetota bacterium]